jgi:hypothetical protein
LFLSLFSWRCLYVLRTKRMLNEVAVEENELRKKEFKEGIKRNKNLLLRIAEEKKLHITINVEGTDRALDCLVNVKDYPPEIQRY